MTSQFVTCIPNIKYCKFGTHRDLVYQGHKNWCELHVNFTCEPMANWDKFLYSSSV